MENEKKFEKQDSIKVNQTSTGKFSYEIKRYFQSGVDNPEDVINNIKKIYDFAKSKFEGV